MRPYSEAVKADVRRRMGPPHRQSVTEIAQDLGIHVITLYKWRKAWRLQGEVVPATQKDPRVGAQPTSSLWCWRPPA
jgi:transposase-like protein